MKKDLDIRLKKIIKLQNERYDRLAVLGKMREIFHVMEKECDEDFVQEKEDYNARFKMRFERGEHVITGSMYFMIEHYSMSVEMSLDEYSIMPVTREYRNGRIPDRAAIQAMIFEMLEKAATPVK